MVNIDYLYNPKAAKPYFDKNYFVDKKLGFQVIENGMILPHKKSNLPGAHAWGLGGIVDSEDNYIGSSAIITTTADRKYTPPQSQFNTALKPSFTSECFSLFGVIL